MRDYSEMNGEKNPNYKTGLKAKNCKYAGIYNSWNNMKQRCTNSRHPKYPRYGGRGIKIFEDWLEIKNFYQWAKDNGWRKGYSIDRIDNNGDYCPENCRWISVSENSRKKRTTKIDFATALEIRARIAEDWYKLAKEYGCSHGNIWFIMNNFTHVQDGECSRKLKERKKKCKTCNSNTIEGQNND